MSKRRRARELALQLLYQWEMGGDSERAMDLLLSGQKCPREVKEYAEKLTNGVKENLAAIDDLLAHSADNWELGRMAAVDRSILRFATYELLFLDEIPPKVSIDEAIEIARKYGTVESWRFINGVLDRVKKEIVPPPPPTS